jgi:hypothetical protein
VTPLVVLGGAGALFAWHKFFREEDQPPFADEIERFKYGSIGAEVGRGIPYWVWLVLPRIFPDLLPGPGGYKSFGLVWEEGKELPAGFSKKVVGFPRVANNCAICHTVRARLTAEAAPVLYPCEIFEFLWSAYHRFLAGIPANSLLSHAAIAPTSCGSPKRCAWDFGRRSFRFPRRMCPA